MKIDHLITEAVALGGMNLCAVGHQWESSAGRGCPYSHECLNSQSVYECSRCGAVDYGEVGGPGHRDCVKYCQHAKEPRK